MTISVAQFAEVTPTAIPPTPQIKITKLERGIVMTWIIGGGILLFVTTAVGLLIYRQFKEPQDVLP